MVILDVTGCPSLSKKYWDISKIPEILLQMEKTKKVKRRTSSPMWGKKTLDGDEKDADKSVGERQGEPGGFLDGSNGAKTQKDGDGEGKCWF